MVDSRIQKLFVSNSCLLIFSIFSAFSYAAAEVDNAVSDSNKKNFMQQLLSTNKSDVANRYTMRHFLNTVTGNNVDSIIAQKDTAQNNLSYQYNKDTHELVQKHIIVYFSGNIPEFANALKQNDLVAAYYANAASLGFEPYNVGDSIAVLWLQAWQALHYKDQTTITSAVQQAVIKQFRIMSMNAGLHEIREAFRQIYSEVRITQAMIIGAGYHYALQNNDEAAMKNVINAAKNAINGIKHYTLSEKGFALEHEQLSTDGAKLLNEPVDLSSVNIAKDIETDDNSSIDKTIVLVKTATGVFLQRNSDGQFSNWDGKIEEMENNQFEYTDQSMKIQLINALDLSSLSSLFPVTVYIGHITSDGKMKWGYFDVINKDKPGAQSSSTAPSASNDATQSSQIKGKINNTELEHYALNAPYEAMFCDHKTSTNYGNYSYDTFAVALYKDGTVYYGMTEAIEHFDISASRKANPKNWGVWRRNGEAYEIKVPSLSSEWKKFTVNNQFKPARIDERLHRKVYFKTSWSVPGVGAGSTSEKNWVFSGSGRFVKGTFNLHTSGTSFNGEFSSAANGSDEDGNWSAVNANSAYENIYGDYVGGVHIGSKTDDNDGSKNRGSYQLSGHTMTLTYDNGQKEKKLFGYCEGKRDNLFMSGTEYWMYKSEAEKDLHKNWDFVITENENRFFKPKELNDGQDLRLTISTPVEIGNADFSQWFKNSLKIDTEKLGTVKSKGQWQVNNGVSIYYNSILTQDQKAMIVYYFARPYGKIPGNRFSKTKARYFRILASDPGLLKQYIPKMKSAVEEAFD